MLCSPQIKTHFKIIIGVLIGFAVIGGVLALIMKYFQGFSDMSQVVNKNPIQQQAVNLVQLGETYKIDSAKIISDFLAASASGSSDVAVLAAQAQKALLSLTVPGELRQKHLSEVLLLGEIKDLAAAKSTVRLNSKINELKQVFNQD